MADKLYYYADMLAATGLPREKCRAASVALRCGGYRMAYYLLGGADAMAMLHRYYMFLQDCYPSALSEKYKKTMDRARVYVRSSGYMAFMSTRHTDSQRKLTAREWATPAFTIKAK